MKRDLDKQASQEYDLVVVGGGIHGAVAAWEASLRGIKTALLEKDDFGGATSAHSLKVIHGGFRYLQSLNIPRLRMSRREMFWLLRSMPHLIKPLACALPAEGLTITSPLSLKMGLLANEILGWDLAKQMPPELALPAGKILNKKEYAEIFPPVAGLKNNQGAALWFDGQVVDSERLTFAFVQGAVENSADAANYAQVTGFLFEDGRIQGVKVWDRVLGRELQIRSRMILNTAGPWMSQMSGREEPPPSLALGLNLVLDRQVSPMAIALPSPLGADKDPVCGGHRYLFMAPWRGHTLLGTSYKVHQGPPEQAKATRQDAEQLLAEFNAACPGLDFVWSDVTYFHQGLLPLAKPGKLPAGDGLAEQIRILDHESLTGTKGLVSVLGVKYTTARAAAEQAIDVVAKRLGKGTSSKSLFTLPPGGDPLDSEGLKPEWVSDEAWFILGQTHGSRAKEPAQWGREDPSLTEINQESPGNMPACLVVHAIREEMAQTLGDIILRRTPLGQTGCPSRSTLERAAAIAAKELGWDQERIDLELEQAEHIYSIPSRVNA